MLHALIRSIEPEPDGTIRIRGSAPLAGLDHSELVDVRATAEIYSNDGDALREMDSAVAAGIASVFADDDQVTVSARVVDRSTIKKIQRGVLKMFAVGKRFVRLVDRPGGSDNVTMWKKAQNEMSDVFMKTFWTEFTKAMAGGDDDPNHANPNRIDDPPVASTGMIESAVAGLRQADMSGEPAPNSYLEAFAHGVSGRGFPDFLRSNGPAPKDPWPSIFGARAAYGDCQAPKC
jgi:hypothetical protein